MNNLAKLKQVNINEIFKTNIEAKNWLLDLFFPPYCLECGEEGRPQPKLADIKLKLKQKLEENELDEEIKEF